MDPIITTEDPQTAEICRQYWERDEQGNFVHLVAHLLKTTKLTSNALALLVREHSHVLREDRPCSQCGMPHVAFSRRELTAKSVPGICTRCETKAAEEKKAAEELAAAQWAQAVAALAPPSAPVADETSVLDTVHYYVAAKLARQGDNRGFSKFPVAGLTESLHYLVSKGWARPTHLLARNPGALPATEAGLLAFAVENSALFDWHLAVPKKVPANETLEWASERLEHFRTQGMGSTPEVRALTNQAAILLAERFLLHQLEYLRLAPVLRSNARPEITAALQHFTLGQVFNLIYGSTRAAVKYGESNNLAKGHVVNAMGAFLKKRVNAALENHWEVNSYTWPSYMQMGAMAEAVFVALLNEVPLDWRIVYSPETDNVH